MIVAIDGPAGSGKSTVARIIARKLNFRYIETGSMYRAVAWQARQEGIDPKNLEQVSKLAETVIIEFEPHPEGQRTLVNGQDLTRILQTEEVGRDAAIVAANPRVRDILVAKQRALGNSGDVVMDGRDIGTVVFPQAESKFFLEADPEERARRRYDEMKEHMPGLELSKIVEQVKQRDHEDRTREVSPLIAAADAIPLDTTGLGIDDVVDRMLQAIQSNSGK